MRRVEDIAQQRRVVEPVADLRGRAGTDEHARLADCQDASVRSERPSCARCQHAALPSTGPPSAPTNDLATTEHEPSRRHRFSLIPQQGRRPRGHEHRRGARGHRRDDRRGWSPTGARAGWLASWRFSSPSGETAICGGSSSCTARTTSPSSSSPTRTAALPRRGCWRRSCSFPPPSSRRCSRRSRAPSPGRVLVAGYAAQAVTCTAVAAAMLTDAGTPVVYVLLVGALKVTRGFSCPSNSEDEALASHPRGPYGARRVGTLRHGGRYSPPGLPVVNFASEAGLAVLVALRYLPGDPTSNPDDYVLGWTEVDATPNVSRTSTASRRAALSSPAGWRSAGRPPRAPPVGVQPTPR